MMIGTSVDHALEVLRRGGIVAIPTETVYGLAADARNPDAVRRIFTAKGRPADHPLIEVGFMDGRIDPELFMQDDPTVGSVFSADKVTWKLRHIYGLTAVDYRGFQRGTQ